MKPPIRARILASALAASTALSTAAMGQDRFDGTTVRWLIPAGHNAWILNVHKDAVREALGIELEAIEVNETQLFETSMADWATGSADYCLVTLLPPWNGDFMAGGFLRPLDDLLAESTVGQEAYTDIIEQFRILATQWEGVPYAFGQDGDVTNLYYRKDVLADPKIQSGFKEKYGYDLPSPPSTVKELADISEYLTGWDWDDDGQEEYGYSQVWKIVQWRTFLPLFGSVTGGDVVFDAEMNPQINRQEVADMLNDMRRLLNASPPGAADYSYVEAPAAFINGDVAFHWFWGDVAKLIYTPGWTGDPKNVGEQWTDMIGYAPMPGYTVGGQLYQFNELSGKIVGVTADCKEPEAAFAALAYLSHPDRGYLTVDSTTTGSDPFTDSQLSRSADEWDVKIDQAYLDLIPTLMRNGYPALYIPGGQEYYDSIDRRVSAFLVDPSADATEVLAAIEEDWQSITDARGRDEQIKVWNEYLANLRALGLKAGN